MTDNFLFISLYPSFIRKLYKFKTASTVLQKYSNPQSRYIYDKILLIFFDNLTIFFLLWGTVHLEYYI